MTTLRPARGPARDLFPSQDVQTDGPIGRFFSGDATSEIGLRQSAGRDVWVAMQPDTSVLQGAIAEANRPFGGARPELQGIVVAPIAQRWVAQSPPASFRLIVRTGVSWMWLGALGVTVGALIALWPRGVSRRHPRRGKPEHQRLRVAPRRRAQASR